MNIDIADNLYTNCLYTTMANPSLNEDRLSILIWQISNLWQSKIRQRLKNSNITFNEYNIRNSIQIRKIKDNITQQEICKNS